MDALLNLLTREDDVWVVMDSSQRHDLPPCLVKYEHQQLMPQTIGVYIPPIPINGGGFTVGQQVAIPMHSSNLGGTAICKLNLTGYIRWVVGGQQRDWVSNKERNHGH